MDWVHRGRSSRLIVRFLLNLVTCPLIFVCFYFIMDEIVNRKTKSNKKKRYITIGLLETCNSLGSWDSIKYQVLRFIHLDGSRVEKRAS